MDKIDFVITWVDGGDEKWIKEKNKYLLKIDPLKVDARKNRYRDMELLKYWFRGVEKYAPWVNKIYFVTCGQKPEWLDESNKKLVLIKHSDYMPSEVLPTFNSNSIEALLYKIPGLSEKFVYFNDDTFLINNVKKTDFFNGDIPVDSMSFHPINPESDDKRFYLKVCNNLEVINRNFNFAKFKKDNLSKCFSLKQGKHLLITMPLLSLSSFRGFYTFHLPVPYLKSTFKEVWDREPEILNKTMSFKFRNNEQSVNHWLFQYWQFASGNFKQRSSKFGIYKGVTDSDIDKCINGKKYKAICINDNVENCNFEAVKNNLHLIFEKKLNKKSSFEK